MAPTDKIPELDRPLNPPCLLRYRIEHYRTRARPIADTRGQICAVTDPAIRGYPVSNIHFCTPTNGQICTVTTQQDKEGINRRTS